MGKKEAVKVFIVAAEDSASLHAKGLMEAFNNMGNFYFYGVGSSFLSHFMDIKYSSSQLSFVGFEEPGKLLKIAKIYLHLKRLLLDADLVLLIDYPGMNLRIAKYAKSKGKPVCYYVAPQVWAWWTSRIKSIRNSVDRLVCLFPFEVDFFKSFGVKACFFGHPLVDRLKGYVSGKRKYISFLPGSRSSEVKSTFNIMLSAAKELKSIFPWAKIAFIRASGVSSKFFSGLPDFVELIEPDKRFEIMGRSLCAVSVSGTAVLELGILKVPTVVVYKTKPLTYEIGRRLAKVSNLGIINILAGREIFPELIQDRFNTYNVVKWVEALMVDSCIRENIILSLDRIVDSLKGENPYRKAAEFFSEVLP